MFARTYKRVDGIASHRKEVLDIAIVYLAVYHTGRESLLRSASVFPKESALIEREVLRQRRQNMRTGGDYAYIFLCDRGCALSAVATANPLAPFRVFSPLDNQ